ncbi:MFS transporter [Bacillus altitudinis]|uniref:MFS transporter n=1 Tax=Bacillus altitudinis TaxID=293387 RepID=UPI00234D8C68|nr:MFS transporter [Bacillus altitudinis]MDC7795198.1 MFS transporter [Bacillus altitudinis]
MNISRVRTLVYLDTMIVFIGALVWTGLPLYFFEMTGSYFYAGSMYLIGGFSFILSNIVSNYLFKVLSRYTAKFFVTTLSILTLASFFALNNQLFNLMFFLMLAFQFFINGLSFILESGFNMFLSNQPHKDIAYRNMFLLSAKTIGFFSGPILFIFFGSEMYLVFLLFFIGLLVYEYLYPIVAQLKIESISFANVEIFKKVPKSYLFIMFIDGMFLPVVMNYSFIILKETFSASDLTVSLFWLIGGVSVLLGNLLIRRMDIQKIHSKVYLITIYLTFGLILMILAPNSSLFLIGFFILTLINPLFMSLIKASFLVFFDPHYRSMALAGMNTLNQLGTILIITVITFMLESSKFFNIAYIIPLCLCIGIIRFLILKNILKRGIQ